MSGQQEASRPRSICAKRARGTGLSGCRTSTPTTRKPESNGSSLVPRFPAIPVTRTVRSVAMTTEAELAGLAAARSPDSAQAERSRPPAEAFLAVASVEHLARPAFLGED